MVFVIDILHPLELAHLGCMFISDPGFSVVCLSCQSVHMAISLDSDCPWTRVREQSEKMHVLLGPRKYMQWRRYGGRNPLILLNCLNMFNNNFSISLFSLAEKVRWDANPKPLGIFSGPVSEYTYEGP